MACLAWLVLFSLACFVLAYGTICQGPWGQWGPKFKMFSPRAPWARPESILFGSCGCPPGIPRRALRGLPNSINPAREAANNPSFMKERSHHRARGGTFNIWSPMGPQIQNVPPPGPMGTQGALGPTPWGLSPWGPPRAPQGCMS